jgi:hypothetical protein
MEEKLYLEIGNMKVMAMELWENGLVWYGKSDQIVSKHEWRWNIGE